jgi:protein-tyrosine phosphatase
VRDRPLPSAYWVEPGPLLAGAHPGARSPETARRQLAALLDAGVTHVFDLTTHGEYGVPHYAELLQEEAARRGRDVRYTNLPIRDLGCPAHGDLERLLDELDRVIDAGGLPYVHCHGGIGRTGTVVGCYLVRHGRSGREAIDQIAAWRRGVPDAARVAPEHPDQVALVLGWPRGTTE